MGGQGRCERRSEVFVKIKKKKFFFFGGAGLGGQVGIGLVGVQGGYERNVEGSRLCRVWGM